jgi:hypothetical protein
MLKVGSFQLAANTFPIVMAGGLPDSWTELSSLTNLYLYNVTFPNGTNLPGAWGGPNVFSRLQGLHMDSVRGLTSPVPESWASGFNSLTNLQLDDVTGFNDTSSLSRWLQIVMKPASNTTSSNPYFYWGSLMLSGMGLQGSLPDWIYGNQTRYG